MPPFSSPFSWSITRGTAAKDSNATNDDDNMEMKKEMGLVSKERQLARLRVRMAEEGVVAVARLGQQASVPCRRCVDHVVAP